jgi:hypothetical protein
MRTIGSITIRNDPVKNPEDFILSLSNVKSNGYGEARFGNYRPQDRAEGGYWMSSFTIYAREHILKEMFENGLGRYVEVWGYGLEPDFEGRIVELTFNYPPDQFTNSLRNLANYALMRADTDADGEVERSTAIENTNSQNIYGVYDAIMSGGELDNSGIADQAVQQHVDLRAFPMPDVKLGGKQGEMSLDVTIHGYITTLQNRVYNQTTDTGTQSMTSQVEDIIGSLTYISHTLKNDLVAWWQLDELSGDRVSKIGGITLADSNSVLYQTGKRGNAAQFVSGSSQDLWIADTSSLSFGDEDFTVACWVKFTTTTATQGLVAKWDNGSNDKEYQLQYSNSLDRICFSISNDGSTVTTEAGDILGSPADGTWYCVIGWHDSVNDTLNIQINDGEIDSQSYANGCNDNIADFAIGSRGHVDNFANALIDEVAIWSRVLTEEERSLYYLNTLGITVDHIGESISGSVTGVGEFIAQLDLNANTTPVTKEYDVDRRAFDILMDMPKLGDAGNNRWLLDCYGRDATAAVGRKVRLHQASPVIPPTE